MENKISVSKIPQAGVKAKRNYQFVMSDFYCCVCGKRLTLPRPMNRQREKGHIKTMLCPFCKGKRDFTEVRYKDHVIDDK